MSTAPRHIAAQAQRGQVVVQYLLVASVVIAAAVVASAALKTRVETLATDAAKEIPAALTLPTK